MHDLISIILAILALLGNCGWLLNAKKYREEVQKQRIDNAQADLDLADKYVRTYHENIYEPMAAELQKLREAITAATSCDYLSVCPVRQQLCLAEENHPPLDRDGDDVAPRA